MSLFTKLLIETREKKGLLKSDVANIFGWTPMYYGRYEKGQLNPSRINCGLFAKFLNISEEEVLLLASKKSEGGK